MNLLQSAASVDFLPLPEAFHLSMSTLYCFAVLTQSLELEILSASLTIISLVAATFLCSASKPAKWVRLLLSNLFREDENLFHSAVSTFLSRRGAFFQSSSNSFNRAVVAFHATESTRDSASVTIFSLIAVASAFLASFSAA